MRKLIDDYMKLSYDDRQSHLDLTEDCLDIGTKNSSECRALLAYFLNTYVPSGKRIHCCHACNNGWCSNPKHLYWGTIQETWLIGSVIGSNPLE